MESETKLGAILNYLFKLEISHEWNHWLVWWIIWTNKVDRPQEHFITLKLSARLECFVTISLFFLIEWIANAKPEQSWSFCSKTCFELRTRAPLLLLQSTSVTKIWNFFSWPDKMAASGVSFRKCPIGSRRKKTEQNVKKLKQQISPTVNDFNFLFALGGSDFFKLHLPQQRSYVCYSRCHC